VYEEVAPKFDDYKQSVKVVPSQIGFMAFINGRFAGLDIVGDQNVFTDLYESLVNSYFLDALSYSNEDTLELNTESLRSQVLDELTKSQLTRGDNIGAEKREEIKGDNSLGELVSFNEKPVHLALFHN